MEKRLEMISNLFEGKEVRSVWSSEHEDYYFSVVDVIEALTGTNRPRKYWDDLKRQLTKEGSQVSEKIGQLKLKAKDGKMRETDVLDTEGILRLIESVPSPKAEPFKVWLAQLGRREIDSFYDPSINIDRMIDYYLRQGHSLSWIKDRLDAIVQRKKLTETWRAHGIEDNTEFAILTNKIYKTWSGMTAKEYKDFKGITKESLRDNMSDIEMILTNLGEVATKELTNIHHPIGLEQNKLMAEVGGTVALNTRKDLEDKLGKKVIEDKQ